MRAEHADAAVIVRRKTETLSLRMDPDVKQAAERAAAQDRRSLSSLIEILLIAHCKALGFLTEEGRLPKRKPR